MNCQPDENIDFDTKMKTLQAEPKELLVQEEKSKADLLAVFRSWVMKSNHKSIGDLVENG